MVKCRLCGERYSEFGDGYDGFCPNCADRLYGAGFWDADDADPERADPSEWLRTHPASDDAPWL